MIDNPALEALREALAKVPEQYHEAVARELTHDISVILRTLEMVRKAG